MAKKKQEKKRKKPMAQTKGKPALETRQSAPKTFGASSTWSGTNSSAMRSPGSQRKR